ncbi:MAG: polyhydroxyalkanoate biosynthesis repressor PhaR, partial [Microcystaceae cyanobacterium]
YSVLDKKMTEQYNALDKKFDVYIAKTDEKLTAIDKRLERLETSQKNQIWALIGILGSVLVGLTGKLLFLSK